MRYPYSGVFAELQRREILTDQQNRIDAQTARSRWDDIDHDLDHLRLVVEAMWSLLAERAGVTVDDLVARVQEIDRSDGTVDGRHAPPPRPCPACAAMVAADRATCQFCGAAVAGVDPFA